ncbi:hypothetical protein [Phaeacidiphilus oryzae]|uniref:hypothetical protein n=1 Tax=Phaeacidiphilus oryzae TaxID=348818 RepID=UPI000690DE37|nr:hypothetical protein [Phaeacidiphilus oryzae]
MLLIGRLWRGGAGGIGEIARLAAVAAASATAGGLLLRALGRALSAGAPGPVAGQSVLRLLWCLPALGAVAWLCAVAAGSVPGRRPERVAGLAAAGVGPYRLRLLVACETGLACALGSAAACGAFLALRAGLLRPLLPAGAQDRLAPALGSGAGLPAAGLLTLLLVVPLVGAGAAARPLGPPEERHGTPGEAWAGALLALGTAAEFGARGGWSVRLPVLQRVFVTGAVGWALTLAGLAAATPLVLRALGGALAAGRPGGVRLLAGRGLQSLAPGLAGPLAVAALGVGVLWGAAPAAGLWSWAVRAVAAGCALGALAMRAAELAAARRGLASDLTRLGASAAALRAAAALCALTTAAAATALAAAAALATRSL